MSHLESTGRESFASTTMTKTKTTTETMIKTTTIAGTPFP
jgi:hypothetical protein